MKFSLVKQLNNTFKVAYDSDHEKLRRIKAGDILECEVKKPRNYQFHKKFFALVNMVYQNQERYNNIDHLRHDLIAEAGFYDAKINLQGEEVKVAKSISFSSMDQEQFNELYNRVVDVIVKYFHFDEQDIQENIIQFF